MTFLTHLSESTLQRLVDGDLPEAEARAAKTHLESCAPCRRRSVELSAMFAALAAPRTLAEPPADFLASVMERVEREPGLVTQRIRPRVALGAAAAGLATAIAGVALGGGIPLPGAEVATGITAVVSNAGLLGTLARAAAPVLAAASLASATVLSPFLVRALRQVPARRARATVRQ